MTMKTVADVMSTELVTAGPQDVVGETRDQMLATGVHMVPVLDEDGRPIGVVSAWDLVEEYAPNESVQNAMTTRVETIGPSATIQESAILMREGFMHHLVVVEPSGRTVGVISTFDLLGELTG